MKKIILSLVIWFTLVSPAYAMSVEQETVLRSTISALLKQVAMLVEQLNAMKSPATQIDLSPQFVKEGNEIKIVGVDSVCIDLNNIGFIVSDSVSGAEIDTKWVTFRKVSHKDKDFSSSDCSPTISSKYTPFTSGDGIVATLSFPNKGSYDIRFGTVDVHTSTLKRMDKLPGGPFILNYQVK